MDRPIARIELGPQHKPTGIVRHYRDSGLLPAPHSLLISELADSSGFYLFYLDADGKELNDTYHDTLEAAEHQAEIEFGVKSREWIRC